VSVDNTGGGSVGGFVFAILLPDGSTIVSAGPGIVSAGPGIGARCGRLGDLRTLVPVARGISLAGAFQYTNDQFFSHTFDGAEPNGTYLIQSRRPQIGRARRRCHRARRVARAADRGLRRGARHCYHDRSGPAPIVARFSDGVELPGVLASLTITATNATVAPAGGQVTLPILDR
jgi:hypothetical protein